jgi:hypothetical protein
MQFIRFVAPMAAILGCCLILSAFAATDTERVGEHQSSPTQFGAQVIWQMQDSGTTAGLRGIDSVDGMVAWASGTGGTVLKTTDGGAHWLKCAIPDADKDGATLDFRGVQGWDAQTAIVMASGAGDKSRLYKSTDGCKSWVFLFRNEDRDGFWDSFSVNGKQIMILGDPVDATFVIEGSEDGGATWKRDDGLPPSRGNEAAFAASNSALFVDWEDGIELFGTGGLGGSRIFTSCDPCTKKPFDRNSWYAQPTSLFGRGQSVGIFSIAARLSGPPVFFVAVGGDHSKPDQVGLADYSQKWLRWTASTTPPTATAPPSSGPTPSRPGSPPVPTAPTSAATTARPGSPSTTAIGMPFRSPSSLAQTAASPA